MQERVTMHRSDVVQRFLDLFEAPSYLEIGVSQAVTFHAISAAHKVAVDPRFRFDPERREPSSDYHEQTSDDYFCNHIEREKRFDVIFIDGLHTFEQTLRDLINAVDHLKPGGIIVVDDVLPTSYHSSLPAKDVKLVREAVGATDRAWVGDVYRLVFFVQSFFQLFDYATIVESHGLLVMWRGKRDRTKFDVRSVEAVARMDFRDSVLQRNAYNLKPFAEIMDQVMKAQHQRSQDFVPSAGR
jgi:hypothetical protein